MKKLIHVTLAVLLAIAVFGCDTGGGNSSSKPSYIVVYNANDGSGNMKNSTHIIGTAKNLNINTFTRNGYTFIGWAISPTGAVVYTDEQSVTNLSTTAGDRVILYAVWSTIVPGSNLTEKLAWLQTNALSNIDYTVEINTDEEITRAELFYDERINIGITLKSTGSKHTISHSSSSSGDSLFFVGKGVTFTLEDNVILRGRDNDNYSLIRVYGTFIMNGGEISGHTGEGGVSVGSYSVASGTFIMNGGVISGNTSKSKYNDYGGGVTVNSNSIFTMNGGIISGNTATAGGGVFITQNGTFIMNSGEISGNTATSSIGGGVFVLLEGKFIMNGGIISGNTARSGGGVAWCSRGNFRITSGIIYGSGETEKIKNTASYEGAALYVENEEGIRPAEYGTFNGDTWNSNGSLNTTDNTIHVVNGVLQ